MSKSFKILAVLAAAVLLAGLFVALLWPGPAPAIESSASRPGVGRGQTTLQVRLAEPSRGVTGVRVEVVQDGRAMVLDERSYPPPPTWALWRNGDVAAQLDVVLSAETIPDLSEGTLTVTVTALGTGAVLRSPREAQRVLTLPVRLSPPTVGATSIQNYAAQGGSGVVVYRVGDSALEQGGRDGVEAGDWFFPGHPLPEGGPDERFALYGIPYDLDDSAEVRLIAEDALGNRAATTFLDRFFTRPLRRDTIRLPVAFMEKVVPEIYAQTSDLTRSGDLLTDYLEVNGGLRERNARELQELAVRSRPEFLWSGAFQQLPNSQVTSNFADRRTYVFEGETVDHQDHLGFDLASVQRAPVPAPNGGVVLLARYFGIYGNTVVVDHGFGLMSLHSHLSSLDVAVGDEVAKGDVLGRTGETGLAGGDHLHFTLLLEGLPVNPVEWWDPNWVNDRVLAKFRARRTTP